MNSFTKKYKVGIVGFGFVGEAQAYLFSPIADIKIYDIDVKKKTHELNEVLKQDIVFVSLPTPMEKDGKLGFGGSCFPKDINALINFGNDMGLKFNVLEAAWKTNLEVRPEKDWEKLKKRAVV